MNTEQKFNFVVQTSSGEIVTQGIADNEHEVIAIDPTFSLLALAQETNGQVSELVKLSIEILLDDVNTNLSSAEFNESYDHEKQKIAAHCIHESFLNINDYLISLQEPEAPDKSHPVITMSALQLVPGFCSYIHSADYCCVHYSHAKKTLVDMNEGIAEEDMTETQLGDKDFPALKVDRVAVATNDLILLTHREVMQLIGEEFFRVTLSRFHDSPEMAIRQINNRAHRNGINAKPLQAVILISDVEAKSKSWFSRFK